MITRASSHARLCEAVHTLRGSKRSRLMFACRMFSSATRCPLRRNMRYSVRLYQKQCGSGAIPARA